MDNLENDILELFEDGAGGGRASERSRGDSRSQHKRPRHSRRDEYSGSDDMDIDSDEDVDIEGTKGDAHERSLRAGGGGDSDGEPLDEWGEDLMGDQKDRRWLASLAEVERERILSERQERRDILNEQRELRLKLKAGVRVSASDAAGRAARASRSRRDAARGAGSLSDLKRARERRRQQGDADRWSSSASDDGGSEAGAEPVASLDEINAICLPRNMIERWLFRPFLADAIVGCFVRIVTRIKDSTGEYNQYKMMEIVGVVRGEGRSQPPYHLNKTLTDKYLTLRFGATEKDYSMETISNSPIKPEEHAAWEAALRADRVRAQTTVAHVQKKLQDLEAARNYQLSEAEVSQMIAERNRLRRIETGGVDPSVALERSQLNQLRIEARQNGDWEQLKTVEARLAELNKLADAKPAGGQRAAQPTATPHRQLLAPSTARSGSGAGTPDAKASFATRRKKLLTPSSAAQQPSPAAAAAAAPGPAKLAAAGPESGRFAHVPELRVQELSLRARVTPGYAQMMAANGGYDMSFLKQ